MTETVKPAAEYEEEIRVANVIQAMDSIGRMGAAMAFGSLWRKVKKSASPARTFPSRREQNE